MIFLAQLPKEQLMAQLQNGLILMLLGMGTVFVFLTLLVFLTKAFSAFVRKVAPQKPTVATVKAPVQNVAVAASSEPEIAAAIVAAFAKSKQ
jgi:oxaloacetate decarboxylase gamma subunit